jgi:glycine hydroxymethyltransferase
MIMGGAEDEYCQLVGVPGNQGGARCTVRQRRFGEAPGPGSKGSGQTVCERRRARRRASKRGPLCSGGTDNHLMLVDLRGSELTGKLAEETLDKAHITVNKNTVPNDPRSPFVTSGVRIGTPAVTTRGMIAADMDVIAELIVRALAAVGDDTKLAAIAADVRDLCARYPIYRNRLG